MTKNLRLENELLGSIDNHTSARATSKSAFRSPLSSVACCFLCASHFHLFVGVIWPGSFWRGFSITGSKTLQRSASCRPRRELSNEYLLANFGFDTAENEPCEVCPLSAYRSPRWSTTESTTAYTVDSYVHPSRGSCPSSAC